MTDNYQNLYEELKQEHQRLEYMHSALHKITDLADNCQSIESFYHRVHDIVKSLVDAENFFVALIDEPEQRINFVFHIDEEDEDPISIPMSSFDGSLSAIVLARGKPLLVTPRKDRLLIAKNIVKLHGTAGVDWLGVPLIKDKKVIGLMVTQSYTNKVRYKKKDQVFLEFVARHVVTALTRFNNTDELQKAVQSRTKELEQKLTIIRKNEQLQKVLFEISELTNSQVDMDQFNQRLQSILGRLLYVENFYIARKLKGDDHLSFVYYVDSVNPSLAQLRVQNKSRGFTEYLLEYGSTLLLSRADMQELSAKGIVEIKEIKTHSWLGVPLFQQGEIVGVMVVQSYRDDIIFTKNDAALLQFVSQHISSAIYRKDAAEFQRQSQEMLELTVNQRTAALREEIEQRQLMEKQLKYSATHDALTNLPNRSFFHEILAKNIATLQKDTAYKFAVLFIDLDHFKKVNDSLGHHIGDKLLIEVAVKISDLIRNEDTLARIGGDEFVIILDKLANAEIATWVANRIVAIIQTPFSIDGHLINISASIGILLSNKRYCTAEDMLRDADTAMYQAKGNGKGCSEIFDASMHQQLVKSIQLESNIRTGLEKKQFDPYFQPIYDLSNESIIGFEALARWVNDDGDLIMPDEFIPIAEETLLIERIDLQILDKAARILKSWLNSSSNESLYVCCNLFSSHFLRENIVTQVASIIDKYQLPKGSIGIEVTERVLLENSDIVLSNMEKLKELGVRLYLDDFGTGYSSLSYVYKYPFDVIKIDSSFLKNIRQDEKYIVIVKTIIEMAKNLGMNTVAEGIEYQADVDVLSSLDCALGQGYYFSKPLPKDDAALLLIDSYIVSTR